VKAYLTAVELLNDEAWQDKAEDALRSQMGGVVRRGQHLVAWHENERKSFRRGIEFVDAIELRRIWLKAGRHALAASPRRLYFNTGEEEPLREREHELLHGAHRPSGPGDEAALASLISFLRDFRAGATGFVGAPVELDTKALGSNAVPALRVGSHAYASGLWNPNAVFKEVGFDYVPAGTQVVVVGCGSLGTAGAEPCALRIRNCFVTRHAEQVEVRLRSVAEIAERVAAIEAGSGPPLREHTVVHLVLPGKREDRIDQETVALMASLDRVGAAWRRSYSDDDLQYSVPDQLGSLLQGMGGRPFGIEMPQDLTDLWSVGIDLSHRTTSTLCVTLVDPQGALADSWSAPHVSDETADRGSLDHMLRAAASIACQTSADARFLVLRDGRLFEKETESTYLNPFLGRASLLEIRKGGNPTCFVQDGAQSRLPTEPVWAMVPQSQTGFLVTYPMRKQNSLDRVLKVSWKADWNKLGLSPEQIGDVLTRLATAPTLGLRRAALPVPIYWADGIAGANNDDLRFRGQRTRTILAM
jgi:hypothetical protein